MHNIIERMWENPGDLCWEIYWAHEPEFATNYHLQV